MDAAAEDAAQIEEAVGGGEVVEQNVDVVLEPLPDGPGDLPDLELTAEEREVLETEVMELLPDCGAAELEQLIDLLHVDCPQHAKGNRNSLMKIMYTHVLQKGGEEDGGLGNACLLDGTTEERGQ